MQSVTYPALPHRLVWFLAAENYLATQPGEYLMLWQSRPTVIFGLHQDMHAEVNIPWCEAHGVEMYRRKSGGGCVYSDEGNLMISYLRKGDATKAQHIFHEYIDKLASVLQELGINAVTTANNDVLVGGKKVSGNACYIVRCATNESAVIVHGTLLLCSNLDNVTAALKPPQEKLRRHAVASVRQRVTNLQDLGLNDLEQIKTAVKERLSSGTYTLTEADIRQIDIIEQSYLNPDFIAGCTSAIEIIDQ